MGGYWNISGGTKKNCGVARKGAGRPRTEKIVLKVPDVAVKAFIDRKNCTDLVIGTIRDN